MSDRSQLKLICIAQGDVGDNGMAGATGATGAQVSAFYDVIVLGQCPAIHAAFCDLKDP